MNSRIVALTLLIPLFLTLSCNRDNQLASDEMPEEIKQFKKDRDLCDHFRGEEGYNQERRAFLLKQMKTYCTGTDEKLRALRLKYQNNNAVVNSLKKYENRIE